MLFDIIRTRIHGLRRDFGLRVRYVKNSRDVPLALVKIDWGTRTLSLVDFYNLTGDVDADYAHMAQVFQGVKGYHDEQASPVLPWSPASKPSPEASGANKTIHS